MKLPFDPILSFYLFGTGVFLGGSVLSYHFTRSQFFVWTGVLAVLVSLFFAFFFRDPHRTIPSSANLIVSSADGKVLAINDVTETDYINGPAKQIIVFLSPLNVHVNRSPVAGTVKWVHQSKGSHKPAFAEGAEQNEQHSIGLVDDAGRKYLVRQIVGTLARRIVCRVGKDATLKRGERFGIIQFGSRTDVFVPIDCDIKVTIGDHVRGGETILGVLK